MLSAFAAFAPASQATCLTSTIGNNCEIFDETGLPTQVTLEYFEPPGTQARFLQLGFSTGDASAHTVTNIEYSLDNEITYNPLVASATSGINGDVHYTAAVNVGNFIAPVFFRYNLQNDFTVTGDTLGITYRYNANGATSGVDAAGTAILNGSALPPISGGRIHGLTSSVKFLVRLVRQKSPALYPSSEQLLLSVIPGS